MAGQQQVGLTREMITAVFKRTDKDGNGYLTFAELHNLINMELGLKRSRADINEMFKAVDENNDGKVTLDELISVLEACSPNQKREAQLRQAFKRFDKNNDKFLDKSEVKDLLRVAQVPMSDKDIDQLIKEVDTSGDGKMDFDEFLKAVC